MKENVGVSDLLALALEPKFARQYCSYCFKSFDDLPPKSKPLPCENCYFSTYCSAACRACDKLQGRHELECEYMIGKWEPWTTTGEAWLKSGDFIGGIECPLLMYRLLLQQEAGELEEAKGCYGPKTWSNLLTHSANIKAERRFTDFFDHCMTFIRRTLLPGTPAGKKDEKTMEIEDALFEIYCKILINAHCILVWNANGKNVVIGMALGLDLAAYDHSCSPNAQVHWYQRRAYIVPLMRGANAHDVTKTFISYKWLMESKKTRSTLLARDYIFTCACTRCKSQADHLLTAMRCRGCRAPVALSEIEYDKDLTYRKRIACGACDRSQDADEVERTMRRFEEIRSAIDKDVLPADAEKAIDELPVENLYRAKILQKMLEDSKLTAERRMRYSLEFLHVAKLCMPGGYQQLIPYTLYSCQACVLCGELEKANGLLCEAEKLVELAFVDGPCRFEKLLDYLYQQVVKMKKVDTIGSGAATAP